MKNKFVIIAIVALASLFIATTILTKKDSREEPITITAGSLLEDLTIDEKIKRAEIIVLGEVKSNLPSKWKYDNEKETRSATPQEIFDAEGLFTDSIVQIERVLKGDYNAPIVRVRSFIGESQQIRWVNSSQPSFEKGRIYLLFLQIDTGPTTKGEVDKTL